MLDCCLILLKYFIQINKQETNPMKVNLFNNFRENLLILFIIGNIFIYNNIIESTFVSYSIGYAHSCYIDSNYKMKCFGWNSYKQLGLGNLSDSKGDGLNEMGSNEKIIFIDKNCNYIKNDK